MAWQAARWGALPEAGGLLDQPAGMLAKMAYLDNIYRATRAYWNAKNTAAWADKNPDLFEIYAQARKLESELSDREAANPH